MILFISLFQEGDEKSLALSKQLSEREVEQGHLKAKLSEREGDLLKHQDLLNEVRNF